jgi:NIMA-interacting peptidyl-prolyl cis-trans isomerase 4
MAPKNKGKGKDNGATAGADAGKGGGKLKPATSINVRHILCEKHGRKQDALAELAKGTAFNKVAEDFSEDKARQGEFISDHSISTADVDSFPIGGSLGWQQRNQLLPDFAKVAFELEPSTTANPKLAEVKTQEGYHIIMVEGRK